ncbi:endoribonuclease CG2145-like isoform X1 [Papilio machaon]|uniref:endoribonuclease CG2145-like isoform X1 n=1 Tax=Papilio machaon TaxID=76193 RepID=UPI001E664B2F|nr:endoribonuclease CG2145-like isoform X1 [Papilio machaon]
MDSRVRVLFISTLLILQIGICINKVQRYNTNIDFLLHEAGGITSAPKRDYSAEFPSLKPSSTTQQQSRTTQGLNIVTGTTPKPQSSKRDYVAPQLPTTKHDQKTTSPQHNVTPSPATHSGPAVKPTLSPKRDYVAPQFPTLKPPQQNSKPTGNVKDLINFYDNFNNNNNNNARKPSYSSILQGSSVGTTVKPSVTPKLPSFSSVVGGPTKQPSSPTQTTPPVHKPTVPSSGKNTPATVPVLPSTIVNNKNQGSASNIATDAELQAISEELLKKDTNNAARYVTINYQEKTTSSSKEDKASQPLLNIASEAWNIPTIQKFLPLLDNYERDTLVNEYVTSQERTEENAFMDAIMSTSVIRHLMNFLKEKGKVPPDPAKQRDFLKQLWFGLYSRGKGKISSSGFEHVFVSELKNGEVSGLHNWIYFSKEESANRVNYLGYLKYVQLNDKGVVIKLHFNQQGVDKPVDSMFIGTSPELEIALYTLCFVTREGDDCRLKLANKDVNILTHNFRYRSKNYIGSAFPQI